MHPNIERCILHLSAFAELLGWRDLESHCQDADGLDVVWYTSGTNDGGDTDLILQINESPVGNTDTFAGAVYAIRYDLYTGWHSFSFPSTGHALRDAISQTDAWLNRKWFADDKLRVQFSNLHPECTAFDWKRIRKCPPPHEP